MKKVVLAGGSGFLGRAFGNYFRENGYRVIVLTRGEEGLAHGIEKVNWDAKNTGDWVQHLESAAVLINLSGKSVDCRYNEKNKRAILASRVDATTVLCKALGMVKSPPELWLNASTASIYIDSEDQAMDEDNGIIGNDFSESVAIAWEKALFDCKTPKTRKVALRISLVLGEGGVYPVLSKLTKIGLGGHHGTGRQKFAWIHIEDMLGIVDFLLKNKDISGPVNCAVPSDLTNKAFMKALRKRHGFPFGIPSPKPILEIGSFVMQTESELLLKSRYVHPKRLLENGFVFKYSTIKTALEHLPD